MDRKMLTIILAVLLIASFFLPFYNYEGRGGASGLDFITAKEGNWQKYLFLLFPLSGLLLLIGAVNNENYMLSRGLLCLIPLLTLLYMMFINPLIEGAKFDLILKSIGKNYGIGLWVTIATSLVLAFYQPRK
ncbi:MAG: hypothetical protein ACT4OJ_01145 [Bacteroidota bacterium]